MPRSRRGRRRDAPRAGRGNDPARKTRAAPNAQELKTEGSEPAAPSPDNPRRPARPCNRSAAAIAFVRPRRLRSGRAHGTPGHPRGAPIVAPARRSFTFRFLPTARGLASSTAKPGTAGQLLKLGGCSERTLPGGRLPPPSLRAPGAEETFTPPRRQSTSRSADPLPHSALSELSPDKPPRTHRKARNEAARLGTKSSAAGGRSLRSRHFPQPVRARTRAPPQHFRFQTRSSFKVISVRPAN